MKPIAGWVRERIIKCHLEGMSQADTVLRLGVHRNTVSLVVREYLRVQAMKPKID